MSEAGACVARLLSVRSGHGVPIPFWGDFQGLLTSQTAPSASRSIVGLQDSAKLKTHKSLLAVVLGLPESRDPKSTLNELMPTLRKFS